MTITIGGGSVIITIRGELQDTFNRVKEHLYNQARQSVNDVGTCMYRDGNGGMCAFGCLIDDSDYYPNMERMVIDSLCRCKLVQFDNYTLRDLCESLQNAHDGYLQISWGVKRSGSFREYLNIRLSSIAEKFDLQFRELDLGLCD